MAYSENDGAATGSGNLFIGTAAGLVKIGGKLDVDKLAGIADSANNYSHPSDGADPGAALVGAYVFSDITVNTAGHVTGSATRQLTAANVSAIALADLLDADDMTGAVATNVPSAESVVAYIAAEIAAAITAGMVYQGGYNATTGLTEVGSKNLDTSPSGVVTGDTYSVTVAGTAFFGITLEIGDMLISLQDDPTLVGHWTKIQTNLTPASIKTMYELNADTNEYPDADVTKMGHISVTQAVDLDDIESDTNTNNSKVSNVVGNLSIGSQTATVVRVDTTNGNNVTLPLAVPSLAGIVSNAPQSFGGIKTFVELQAASPQTSEIKDFVIDGGTF